MPALDRLDTLRFSSILFPATEPDGDTERPDPPDFSPDLNIDQIVASITANRDEYNLSPFFHMSLTRVDAVNYRYEVFRDLEDGLLRGRILAFAEQMRKMRAHLAQAEKLHYQYQKQSWFRDAVEIYCDAVTALARDLSESSVDSRGLRSLRDYLNDYCAGGWFETLAKETRRVKTGLSEIKYSLHIAGRRVTVGRFEPAPDYGQDVLQTFERFKQGETKQYAFDFPSGPEMDHVEAWVLDLVAQLNPEPFKSLDEYCARYAGYLDPTIATFDREVQFYIAYLDHIERFKRTGLQFSHPSVSDQSKEVSAQGAFDLALADKLLRERAVIVTNDFCLTRNERFLVISGPNQGGKTTFARMFGQLHYLASIGCPVPGKEARLFLFDRLFTHFEREEDIHNLSGKLEDDLLRIHKILEQATTRSIVIMNESFVSTTMSDALFLSKQIMFQIAEKDMLCVTVTFLDELASLTDTSVSMVSTIDARDPARRTFKLIRKPADGLAYAAAIAEKYRLTYSAVVGRIAERVTEGVR